MLKEHFSLLGVEVGVKLSSKSEKPFYVKPIDRSGIPSAVALAGVELRLKELFMA